jgi:hypothetical protein
MCPGEETSSAGESSCFIGILGGLLYRFGGIMWTVMYSVTGLVNRAVSPMPFPRTHGISAREIFS